MRNMYTFFDILSRVMLGSRIRLARRRAPSAEDTLPAVLQETEVFSGLNLSRDLHLDRSDASRAYICICGDSNKKTTFPLCRTKTCVHQTCRFTSPETSCDLPQTSSMSPPGGPQYERELLCLANVQKVFDKSKTRVGLSPTDRPHHIPNSILWVFMIECLLSARHRRCC